MSAIPPIPPSEVPPEPIKFTIIGRKVVLLHEEDDGANARPMTPEERAYWEAMQQGIYDRYNERRSRSEYHYYRSYAVVEAARGAAQGLAEIGNFMTDTATSILNTPAYLFNVGSYLGAQIGIVNVDHYLPYLEHVDWAGALNIAPDVDDATRFTSRFIGGNSATILLPMLRFFKGTGAAPRSGVTNVFNGIPESSRALLPNADNLWIWTDKIKIAGVDLITGKMYANPKVWKQLTPGQKSTVLWEELSHQSRVLGQPLWKRRVNAWLYNNTSFGKFAEETMARASAMGSFLKGVSYGWNYPGVNKVVVILQGFGLFGGSAVVGYFGADAIWGD